LPKLPRHLFPLSEARPCWHSKTNVPSMKNTRSSGLEMLKGPRDTAIIGLGTFESDRVRVSSSFRAKRLFSTNPG
jgi:hypothetical protein